MNEPKIAIIIPFQLWDEWLKQCLVQCAKQTYRNFECWLIADVPPPDEWQEFFKTLAMPEDVKVRTPGQVNPAKKRNVAMRESDAEIFAFVDADAYPVEDWLRLAVELMRGDVRAVGGPNLTPPEDPLLRRVPGCIMKSMLGYGPAYIRHCPVSRRTVSELPTCNLVVRRMDGLFFREELDTSEDMTLCEDMVKRGGQILYDPQVVVFHHRRCLFKPFFRQFFNYGLDKARITLQGSDAAYLWHSIPALFTLYLALLPLLSLFPLLLLPLIPYVLMVTVESLRMACGLPEFLLSLLIFPAAHISYGSGYWTGFVRMLARR